MATTLTATIDAGNPGFWDTLYIGYESYDCDESTWVLGATTIEEFANAVAFSVIDEYGGTFSYTITGTIVTFTWNFITDPLTTNCGNLIYLAQGDSNTQRVIIERVTPELCPTCQDVTIDNCGSIIFQAAIPNGTYEVQIEDHQSGITYMQDIEFTGSQGTWDQTNTAGVFTPFSVYTVTILDASGDPVSWIDGTNEYTCMRLTFATFTDTTPQG